MRSLLLLFVFSVFFIYGFRAPFVFLLGYIWIDVFTPQKVGYGLLETLPISFIIGIPTILSVFFIPRPKNEKLSALSLLVIALATWVTLTLLWSEVPASAFDKWNWVFKNLIVASILPFIIRTRLQLEALIWIIVLSGMGHCIPGGIKVLLGGGGYGRALGLVSNSNSGFAESSTLAMFAAMLIPLCVFLVKHSTIIKITKLTKILLFSFMAAALLISLGTYARTGLVSIIVLAIGLVIISKKKILPIFIVAALAYASVSFMGDTWGNRMSSIGDSNEGSAMGRVAVWLWTLDYISSHPFGGGFRVYEINSYDLQLENGSTLSVKGKAFHSIYFEILGEAGIPGFLIFSLIATISLLTLAKVIKKSRADSDTWAGDLSKSFMLCMVVYFAGGAFIGVGFQSLFYYFVAMAAVLYRLSSSKTS